MNQFGIKQKMTAPISYMVLICCVILFVATTVPAKIVFQSHRSGNSEIYVMNDDGSRLRRLTNNLLSDTNPHWSPDGKQIAFTRDIDSTKKQQIEMFIMNADGSSQQNLTNHPALDGSKTWAPDGRRIAFASTRDGDLDLHLIDLESRTIERLTRKNKDGGGFAGPDWSPDGRYIAYEHSAGAIWKNIYTMDADGGNQKPLLPEALGMIIRAGPRWSPDSRRILYNESEYEIKLVKRDANRVVRKVSIVSGKLVIQHKGLDNQQIIELPKGWRPQKACWMANGREILFSADETGLIAKEHGNYEIYRYHLSNGKITKLTNHPAKDYAPHWVPGALSVASVGQLSTLWGMIKREKSPE